MSMVVDFGRTSRPGLPWLRAAVSAYLFQTAMMSADCFAAEGATLSDAKITRFYFFVGAQFFRARGIDHLALAHHMDVVDELEREMRVLLDEQNRQAFFLEPADRFPQ